MLRDYTNLAQSLQHYNKHTQIQETWITIMDSMKSPLLTRVQF